MNDNDPTTDARSFRQPPWNKGKLVGAKPPLRPAHVWAIRTKLQLEARLRDLALFNLAIDSKLRDCDVVAVRVDDVAPNGYTLDRATVRQKKTGRPVQFESTDHTRKAIDAHLSRLYLLDHRIPNVTLSLPSIRLGADHGGQISCSSE